MSALSTTSSPCLVRTYSDPASTSRQVTGLIPDDEDSSSWWSTLKYHVAASVAERSTVAHPGGDSGHPRLSAEPCSTSLLVVVVVVAACAATFHITTGDRFVKFLVPGSGSEVED